MEDATPPNTLIVAGTSSGKTTLLYTLVAGEPGKVTVVVAFTIALQREIKANGKKLAEGGVFVYDWSDELAPRWGQGDTLECVEGLVVVQAEAALTDSFRRFLTMMEARGKLQRVVIDEAHLVLHWGETFRKDLLSLGDLKRPCAPFLCMTATLTPPEEKYLAKRLEVHFSITLRSTTTVKNMRYTYKHFGSQRIDDLDLLNTTIDQLSAEYLQAVPGAVGEHAHGQQPLRGIIFCPSIADVQKVYLHLQSNANVQPYFYHSAKGESDEERAEERSRVEDELANFCDPCHGESGARYVTQWLVATSAAGVGINLPNVQAVLIWGATHSLVDLMQMSGRAGRDHRHLTAGTHIVTNDFYVRKLRDRCTELEAEVQSMTDTCGRQGLALVVADKRALLGFLEQQEEGVCLRQQLEEHLHLGHEAEVCLDEKQEVLCGVCRELTALVNVCTSPSHQTPHISEC